MNCIRYETADILHYGALHFAPDYLCSAESAGMVVQRDLVDSGIDVKDLIGKKIVLDFRGEGQSDQDIVHLIAYLRSVSVSDIAVIFNSVVDTSVLDYIAVSVPTFLVNFSEWFDRLQQQAVITHTDCDFLCLMRRPSETRAMLASRLLSMGLDLRLSFGGMSNATELEAYQCYFGNKQLPMLLDGPLSRDASNNREHNVTSPLLRQCAVNIIAESGEQKQPSSWQGWFVTEKTYKAFGMLQLPIWCAVPGLVSQVRKLGFDVFDDVIDHSYDHQPDPDVRLQAVIDQVRRLSDQNLPRLRDHCMTRLTNNYNHLQNLVQGQKNQFNKILKVIGYV